MKLKVLIYIEEKERFEKVIWFSCELFGVEKPEVTLLQVNAPDNSSKITENTSKAKEYLKDCNIESKILVKSGKVAEEILKESREGKYDLVILGAKYLSGISSSMGEPPFDSILEKVIQNIENSILVVRNPKELNRVLFYTDGSKVANKALEFWANFRTRTRSKIEIIGVLSEFYDKFEGYLKPIAKEQSESEVFSSLPVKKTEDLRESKELLEEGGMEPEDVHLREGEPEEEILKESEKGYDMVIMGTSPGKSIRNKTLYRVARRVARKSKIPALIVKPEIARRSSVK